MAENTRAGQNRQESSKLSNYAIVNSQRQAVGIYISTDLPSYQSAGMTRSTISSAEGGAVLAFSVRASAISSALPLAQTLLNICKVKPAEAGCKAVSGLD